MQNYEQLGAFYLGRIVDATTGETKPDYLLSDARDLTTHAVCVGMTGSGKTIYIEFLKKQPLTGFRRSSSIRKVIWPT